MKHSGKFYIAGGSLLSPFVNTRFDVANIFPFNKLREKVLQTTMKNIHYEDKNNRYITMACVEKVTRLSVL